MKSTKLLGERIKETLSENADRVQVSDLLKYRIHNEIINQKIKEKSSMKKISVIRKIAVIAAALCCLTAISAFAINKASSYVSSSSNVPTYTQLPTDDELSKDVGFVPKSIKEFSNGFGFKDAYIGNVEGLNDSGESMGKYKQANYTYTSKDGKKIELYMDNSEISGESGDNPKAKKSTYNGIDMFYSEQLFKFVPEDYKLTSEDEKAKESGEVAISYGSDKVTTNTFKFMNWSDTGIKYSLMLENSTMTESDIAAMAKEIINK